MKRPHANYKTQAEIEARMRRLEFMAARLRTGAEHRSEIGRDESRPVSAKVPTQEPSGANIGG